MGLNSVRVFNDDIDWLIESVMKVVCKKQNKAVFHQRDYFIQFDRFLCTN